MSPRVISPSWPARPVTASAKRRGHDAKRRHRPAGQLAWRQGLLEQPAADAGGNGGGEGGGWRAAAAWGDEGLRRRRAGDVVHVVGKGYFVVAATADAGRPAVLVSMPSGLAARMR